MSYISLYRKWRSQNFDEIVGQAHIVKTLKNAISQSRIAHAYLFCGPRGTGKTSTARIFAKSLNCRNGSGPTPNPCGTCDNCTKIRDGHAVDVVEIDAASNRGIDEMRDLREKVRYAPVEGRYKVYIIDEVHMLTTEAFNALLKTLEEPPSSVIFVLATTEASRVPVTILSRCQRLDFSRITLGEVKGQLQKISKQEGFEVEDKVLDYVARSGEGSMRDSISLLDQLVSFAGDNVKFDDVVTLLGCTDEELLFSLADSISASNDAQVLSLLRGGIDEGRSAAQIVKDLINHFRNLLFAKVGAAEVLELTGDHQKKIIEQAQKMDLQKIKNVMRALSQSEIDMKWHPRARLVLEVALLEVLEDRKPVEVASRESVTVKRPAASEIAPALTSKPITPALSPDATTTAYTISTPKGDDMIKQHWNKVLELMKEKSLFGYVSLTEGEPIGKNEKGKLVILFRRGYSFHRERLNEQKNKEVLEAIIAQVLGEPLEIETIMEEREAAEAKPKITVETVKNIFEEELV